MLLLTPDDYFLDAGGKFTGKIDNAAEGLTLQGDGKRTWAYNPLMQQWQVVQILKEGQTLWWLAGYYYGPNQNNRWKEIRDVPQNLSIVGSDGAKAFAGDTILIPNMPQPNFGLPGVEPPPEALPLPGMPTPVGTLPGQPLPQSPPAGWPPGWPWPPVALPPEVVAQIPGGPTPGAPPAPPPPETPPMPGLPQLPPGYGGAVVPVGYEVTPTNGAPGPATEEKFWTTGKMVAAGALAVGGVGLIAYFAMRKKPRGRRR